MQIVIDIPDEDYYRIKYMPDAYKDREPRIYMTIRKGTPVPKGHGDIVDISELMDMLCLEDNAYNRDNNIAELITLEDIDRLDVIIPADKGE